MYKQCRYSYSSPAAIACVGAGSGDVSSHPPPDRNCRSNHPFITIHIFICMDNAYVDLGHLLLMCRRLLGRGAQPSLFRPELDVEPSDETQKGATSIFLCFFICRFRSPAATAWAG